MPRALRRSSGTTLEQGDCLQPGVDVELAWLNGTTIRASGNSFAAPHIAGIAALILSKHPTMTPFELKSALRAAASNVRGAA